MNVRNVCYEAIYAREIDLEVLQKLKSLQWLGGLSELDHATISFVQRRINSGKIRIIEQCLT